MRTSLLRYGLIVALLLSACGGGGGFGNTPGLASKPVLSPLNFPSDTASASDVQFVKAYPALSFNAPLQFAQAPGEAGFAYVATQGGQVFRFENRSDVASASLFLDLSDRTRANGEQGLLGIAFDPAYASNRRLYAYYSKNANPNIDVGNAVVERFISSGSSANRSGTVLLNEPDLYNNHNGGSLLFGPDGYLYLALGDGGSGGDPQNQAQNLNSVLGKILRINTDGGTPTDNPFVGRSNVRQEIWAYGLRNPFRVSFDRSTGQLWAGDVGQNAYEEIDVIRKGGNYGWRIREGLHAYSSDTNPGGLIDPLFEYDHSNGNCSITGGVVYRGSAIAKLAGQYVYGDFCSGNVWGLQQQNGTSAGPNTLLGSLPNPSSFGEDLNGEIYATAYDGAVYKLVTSSGGGSSVPRLLSQTGLFTNTAQLSPNPGLVEYSLNAGFWSDGTRKRRWFGLPANSSITFAAEGPWDLPIGAATVKHFEISNADGSTRRLETRVFIHQARGWQGYTYKWNAAGSDAELLDNAQTETLSVRRSDGSVASQLYEYPSRSACQNCHNPAAGAALGLKTAQVNRQHAFARSSENQLSAYNRVALFSQPIAAASSYASQTNPEDSSAPLSQRARSYLDVNCAQCHQPGGPTGTDMDLRRTTALTDTRSRDVPPTGGDLGIRNARRIAPGSKERSLVWERMRRLDNNRMPPIASHVVDEAGLAVVGQWIDAGAN